MIKRSLLNQENQWNLSFKNLDNTNKSTQNFRGSSSSFQTIKITWKNNSKKLSNQKMSTYHNFLNNTTLNFNITRNLINKFRKRVNNKVLKLSNWKVNFKWLKINSKKLKEIPLHLKRILMIQKIKKSNLNKLLRPEINKFLLFKLNFLPQGKVSSRQNNRLNLSLKRPDKSCKKQEMIFNRKN